MKHFTTPDFWKLFDKMPPAVQVLARKNYELLKENPRHPSLHFKQIDQFWSVRVGLHYRALGLNIEAGVLWFWIGTHAEYDQLIR
ncbi:MAG TPA: hypothetical protein VKP65_15610 [Rhodothermales bacterium]|nr:hypothetical protein [Rhodothermales bacterium]